MTDSTQPGLIVRLAGLLAAYGTRAAFTDRDTHTHPTRSAVLGMLAATAGRPPSQALTPHTNLPGAPSYHDLTITIRADNPGTPHTDFHVTGGGYPPHARLRTSAGTMRPPAKSALPTHRHYLAGSAFTLALQGPTALLESIAHHLEHPHWAPYLGRRACIPDEPLLLGPPREDPISHLMTLTPLTPAHPPRPGQTTLPVAFLWESPPAHNPHARTYSLADQPVDFTRTTRTHTQRSLWRTTENLPATLHAGEHPLEAFITYLEQEAR